MIDEITKNVSITMHILSNIGALFIMILVVHFTTQNHYFTPLFIHNLPLWVLGYGVGYCSRQLYLNYRNRQ